MPTEVNLAGTNKLTASQLWRGYCEDPFPDCPSLSAAPLSKLLVWVPTQHITHSVAHPDFKRDGSSRVSVDFVNSWCLPLIIIPATDGRGNLGIPSFVDLFPAWWDRLPSGAGHAVDCTN
jgi:hypothetical protein